MSDVITSIGKHLLFWVPDFGESEFPSVDPEDPSKPRFTKKKMTSFLRLGAPSPEWFAEPGQELLDLVNETGQGGDPRLDLVFDKLAAADEADAAAAEEEGRDKPSQTLIAAHRAKAVKLRAEAAVARVAYGVDDEYGNTSTPWSDDVRNRALGNPGHALEKKERVAESMKLHRRGGWRDHSDGNRITTTYGDKVEVIRGNYKMVVLGRQDDPGEAMGWEAAGSHVDDYAPGTMPGASVFQEFIQDYMFKGKDAAGEDVELKGVWLLANSTENVYQYERNAGNFRTEAWGNLHEEYIGSENPVLISLKPDDGMIGHPIEVVPYVPGAPGPAARAPWVPTGTGRVRSNPHIINKTWATLIEEYTGSPAWRIPKTHSETWAVTTEELTDVLLGTSATTMVGGGTIEATTVGLGTMATTTVGGGTVEVTTVGLGTMSTTTVGGAAIELTAVGGAQVEVTAVAGAIVGATAAVANVGLSAYGLSIELAVTGVKMEVALTGVDLELSLTGLKVEGTLAGKTIEIKEDEDSTKAAKTETCLSYTRTTGAADTLTYVTSSETGTTKTLSLTTLTVTATAINLG